MTKSRSAVAWGCRAARSKRQELLGDTGKLWGDGDVRYLYCSGGFTDGRVCRNIQLYTLKRHILLYVNYTSIKLFKFFNKNKSTLTIIWV